MPWHDGATPVRMQRIAVVTPRDGLREVLVRVADAGTVELDVPGDSGAAQGEAARRLTALRVAPTAPVLCRQAPDLAALEREQRADLLAGEAQLEQHAAAAVVRGDIAALGGWTSAAEVVPLQQRLAAVGGAAAPLPRPAVDPPTLLRATGARRPFAPLIETYATVRYADVDPTLLAGLAYVVMFGAMFADAGQGLLLVLGALLVRSGRPRRLAGLRPVWPFLAAAGLASCVFGLLYGEFFGPTGVLPVIWLAPLDQPVQLLLAGVGLGAVLLAGAYALGTVNRWREGGWRLALYASSGLAGAGIFLGLGLAVAGVYFALGWLLWVGGAIATVAVVLTFLGLFAEAGGGGGGAMQAAVELFDVVVRLGSNLVSFARLAAFGLTHAALALVVWQATTALWGSGAAGAIAAVVVFLVGNAVTFALEGLVAAVQALRLEYYELFSRVFQGEGRPFRPWHVPVLERVSR
ncbi:MAG: V-type ATPase 116kDa subunit family protein [Blastococcus sp.]